MIFKHEIQTNRQHDFPNRGIRVKGRLEIFRKFIRSGVAARPYVKLAQSLQMLL